jgi:hypothetical protein
MVVRHIDCLGARFVKADVFDLQRNEEEVEFMFQRMMCRQDSLLSLLNIVLFQDKKNIL